MSGSIVKAGSGVGPSGDPAYSAAPSGGSVVFLTAAYNLTASDNNKYFICSGGGWTLVLPPSPSGLIYRVRNDQGITGTTGIISIAPATGLIDGQPNLMLLPGQEATLLYDPVGGNWRTFGRQREVVIGTLDITAATASFTILLPVGYRIFELDFTALVSSVDACGILCTLSPDGGNTFLNNYYYTLVYNTSASVAAAAYAGAATTGQIGQISLAQGGQIHAQIYPGSNTQRPSWISHCGYYYSGGAFLQNLAYKAFANSSGLMNAAKFAAASGTINNMSLTVKGIV